MRKKLISTVLSLTMTATMCGGFAITAHAAANTPKYQEKARQMEELNRGLIAAYRTADGRNVQSEEAGVYLSWRLLGDEPLETQEFDIYRNGMKIATTKGAKGTNFVDEGGLATDKYKVVKAGASAEDVKAEPEVTPQTNHVAASSQYTNLANSFIYEDIRLERPDDSNGGHYYTVDKNTEGGANDASVGDLDGDGDYEIVLKWDPTNSKDAAGGGTTGHTYIDGYEIDPTNTEPAQNENGHLYKWRIDLGPHVRSGAHENPFLVYDFDGDGKAEIASITGLGAVDGKGNYVTLAGDTEEIRNADNSQTFLRKGKNIGPEYYTIFDGETGEALCTTEAILIGREDGGDWGDAKMNRSSRYLAAVAYLDGVHPSMVMCRGYYNRAALRAYTWDGKEMALQWEYDSGNSGVKDNSLYGQGNHNLSVGDIDDDGKDEIVYGSAALDHDGKTVMGNIKLGHGDAMHMSDFNNDGVQEVFSVKEDEFKKSAEDLRVASTGKRFWGNGKLVTTDDNGRGVMDNIDDAYALAQYNAGNDKVMALGWSSGLPNTHDFNGDDVKAKPANAGSGTFDNFLVYWDGDLSRELLDANIIQKYDAANGYTTRFWGEADGYTLTGGTTNNYSKRNPSLVADLWGDWREEIIMPTGKGQNDTPALRIYTSTLPTDYRLTTLMHDCQYRLAIAWQNVAYNQPPHTSYYVGSIALASDDGGNTKNYLAPAVPYTKVTYDAPKLVPVTGISLAQDSVTVERGKTVSIDADITPEDATKKGITWTSSDTNVATVANGIVKGVAPGTATITATTKGTADDGTTTFSDTCEVTVYATPVMAVELDSRVLELGVNNSQQLKATVYPDNATDKSVKWTSENTGVATVTSDGMVTGVGYGKTKIVATTNDSGKTAECIVKVKPIDIVDATDEDKFVTTNTDTATKLTADNISATLTQTAAASGGEFHKDFQVFDNNTATLSFHFTTGGQKDASGAWKWAGREYTLNMALLDDEGNNILTVAQPYASGGAGDMTSKVGNEEAKKFDSDWAGSRGDIQGSTKRWVVTFEFDYTNDTCNARIVGTDSTWETINGDKTKTFSLNGAKFKTLKFYTEPNNGGLITASPKLEVLNYVSTEQLSGNSDELYERGANTKWSDADKTDWVEPEGQEIHYAVDTENDRLVYDIMNPGASHSAKKTFDNITPGAIVSYDVDWYFGTSMGRDGNFEYIQFGDKLRLGWTNGYKMLLSTDGGTTYGENTIFTGENTTYTKNVKAIFDTNTKLVTLWFDGSKIGEYSFSDTDGNTADGANSVEFGFTRGGKPPETWSTPNGIDRIRVSQFVAGEETPDINCIKDAVIDKTDTKTVNFTYGMVDEKDSITIIAALYDGGKLVELKTEEITAPEKDKYADSSVTFENDTTGKEVKMFMWDSLDGMVPIGYQL